MFQLKRELSGRLKKIRFYHYNQQGSAIIVGLIFLAALGILTSVFVSNIIFTSRQLNRSYHKKKAFYLAEAGLEKALWSFARQGQGYTGEENTPLAEGGFTIEVLPSNSKHNIRKITSTGFYPYPDKEAKTAGRSEQANLSVLLCIRASKDGRQELQILTRHEE